MDIPWHLSAGRYMIEHREIPRKDFLSWTKEGQPWIDFEWGSEILDYAFERAGGSVALWLLKAFLSAGLLFSFAALLRLWHLPDHWIGAALFPFALSLVPLLDLRPEIFSFILCVIQLSLLEAHRLGDLKQKSGGLLLAHFFLYAIWVNLHAGYPIGLMLCAIYGISAPEKTRKEPFAWVAAGIAGSFLNPFGPKIYSVFLAHWKQLGLLQSFILDWSPPTFLNANQATYWILFFFSYGILISCLFKKSNIPYPHALAAVVFGLLAWQFYRQIAYFIVIVFPMALKAAYSIPSPRRWPRVRPYALAFSFCCLGAIGFRVLRYEKFLEGIDESQKPKMAAAINFLKLHEPHLGRLRMYCFSSSGGPIGYALSPGYKVFMDGRYIFAEYIPIVNQALSSPTSWQKFMDDFHIDLVVLDSQLTFLIKDRAAGGSIWRPADVYCLPRKDWALIYWDEHARIWVKRSSMPKDWLARHEFRFLHPRDMQYLTAGVLSGALSLRSVTPEIDRYSREIGDVEESRRLAQWASEFRR